MFAKKRKRNRIRSFGALIADLTATLADNEKIEIVREPNINDNAPDTVQIVIWSRDKTDGHSNTLLDCYEINVPRQSF